MIILMSAGFASASFDLTKNSDTFTANQDDTLQSSFTIINTGSSIIEIDFTDIIFTSDDEDRNITASFDSGNPFTLENGTNQTISYSFTIPSAMYAGTYTGYFDITDNETNTERYDIDLNLNEIKNISVDKTMVDFGELYHNETESQTFIITNNGNVNVTNIAISSNADSKYELSFSNVPDVLKPGESKTITATVFIPFGESIEDDIKIGNLIVSSDQVDITKADFFNVDVRSYLSLEKVRVDINGQIQSIKNDGEK